MDIRSRGGLVVLAGAGLVVAGGLVAALASPSRAASMPPCDLVASEAIAGQPVALSGSMSTPDGLVEIVARNARGYLREGDVRQDAAGWLGTITFRATDAGPWTIEIIDGATTCRSPLTVTLAAGVTAPPVDTGFVDDTLVPPPPWIDGGQVMAAASLAAAALVLASWLFLAIVAAGSIAGRRPLAAAATRRIVRGAAVVAVLGAVAGAALFVEFVVAISHI